MTDHAPAYTDWVDQSQVAFARQEYGHACQALYQALEVARRAGDHEALRELAGISAAHSRWLRGQGREAEAARYQVLQQVIAGTATHSDPLVAPAEGACRNRASPPEPAPGHRRTGRSAPAPPPRSAP